MIFSYAITSIIVVSALTEGDGPSPYQHLSGHPEHDEFHTLIHLLRRPEKIGHLDELLLNQQAEVFERGGLGFLLLSLLRFF